MNEHAHLIIKYYGVNNTNYYLLYRDPGEIHIAIGQEPSLQRLKSIIETNYITDGLKSKDYYRSLKD